MWIQRSVLSISIVCSFVCCGIVSGATYTVDDDGPADYLTINEAIDASGDGDTIIVNEGTYVEYINNIGGKAITLRSTDPTDPAVVNATIISGGGTTRVIACSAGEGPDTVIDGIRIANGKVSDNGAGIIIYNSSPTIRNCIFSNNGAANGAGICNNNSSPTVTNCIFRYNSASGLGGGMYNMGNSHPKVTNCLFFGNAAVLGGGIYNDHSGMTATNCTFYDNEAVWGGATFGDYSLLNIVNCIVWNNQTTGIPLQNSHVWDQVNSTTHVRYSVVDGIKSWRGDNDRNFNKDPLFINASAGDFRLKWNSPCIDEGNDNDIPADVTDLDGDGVTLEPIPFDLLGNPRVIDAISAGLRDVDMGAYEVGQVYNVTQDIYYSVIQNAIDNANNGDRIEMAPGTYYETIDFGTKNLHLYSRDGAELTTIDGTGYDHVVQCVGGQDDTTILEGFTITGGNANGSGDDHNGGGMINNGSSPTVTNCIFSGNTAGSHGGAMTNVNSSSPTVTNCTFSQNTATNLGGGMINSIDSSPTVTNCTFSNNSAENGGGMWNGYSSNPIVTNCTFSNNSAEDGGGVMYNLESSPILTNCTFTDNSSLGIGGALFNVRSSSPILTNCIFWENTADTYNEIFNSNTMDDIPVIGYCDITDCGLSGAGWDLSLGTDDGGNIDEYPLFVDPDSGDYRLLTSNSPCVDTGFLSDPNLITTDMDGNPRLRDGNMDMIDRVDIGAFEFHARIYNTAQACWYQKIQLAIDHADEDDVLVMEPGRYYEAINFKDMPIRLQSTNPNDTDIVTSTIIDATGLNASAVTCNSSGPDTVIEGLSITGGSPSDHGGGMCNLDSSPTVSKCILRDNSAPQGGGMYNLNSSPIVTNCILRDNSADDGGGMYNDASLPTVTNSIFTGNEAKNNGCGMYSLNSSGPTVTNCILWGNWGATNQIYDDSSSTTSVTYSDVQGRAIENDNIDADPVFADPASDDFRLCWSSPCIDSGNNGALDLPETDMAGNPRIANDAVDMGVLEFEPRVSSTGLQFIITPQEVSDLGKWKPAGSDSWLNSDLIDYSLVPGFYDVEFKPITGWIEPQTLSVRVVGDTLVHKTVKYKPIMAFNIEQIPPFSIDHGNTLMFYVEADGITDPTFNAISDPNTHVGSCDIDSVTGLFTYEPDDISDVTPFTVTIEVISGGVVIGQQDVVITPVPDLPPEFSVFDDFVQPMPASDDKDYTFVNEIDKDPNEILNGKEKTVVSVTITGKTIDVANIEFNPVYIYNGNYHIRDLTIYAETVIIRDPLTLHQTDVTIYAKHLRFEGTTAKIDTTPVNQGNLQHEGLNGGDINLFIESLDFGLSEQRFKTSGIAGKDGWPGYSGAINCTLDAQQPFAWLSPYALKMVIAHAKDAYLYKHNIEAHTILTEYQNLLNIYTELPDYDNIDQQWRFEFNQMHQEIINLVHRLENNLDYFGNPPGWTPMLSFEVWSTAYTQEIERSIRILYLSYWLQNIADDATKKANALSVGRDRLWEQTQQFKSDYDDLYGLIGSLKDDAAEIAADLGRADPGGCSGLLCKLKNKEAELLDRADRNVEESYKVPGWQKTLNTVASIATSTLSGASRTGSAGAALGLAGGVAEMTNDLFSSDDPWQSASLTTDVAKQFNNIGGEFEAAIVASGNVFSSINTQGDIESNADTYLQNLEASSKQIARGMYDVKETLYTTSLDNKEVEAELKKIKATDATFNDLVEQVINLNVKKTIFNRNLTVAMQKLSALSNGINNNILAIDAMNRQASEINRGFDQQAVMYVKDMEKRARDRLLKYHYYMSKAYEYRLLQQYPYRLDIQDVFDEIQDMAAKLGSDAHLSKEDFETIEGVYGELMSSIDNDIVTFYEGSEGSSESSIAMDVIISSETGMAKQIAQLNAGGSATIDLTDHVFAGRENVRISNMQVSDITLISYPDDLTCGNTTVHVILEHSGVCTMQRNSEIYQFAYPLKDNDDIQIDWTTDCKPNGTIYPAKISNASESLLMTTLFKNFNSSDVMLYSRPALWADISLKRKFTFSGTLCDNVKIDSLTLQVDYDFMDRDSATTLRVRTYPRELQPYYTVDKEDISQDSRKDGIGEFYRTYQNGTIVTVTAPENYGHYSFKQWEWRDDISGNLETQTSPELTIDTDLLDTNLHKVNARYEYPQQRAADINADLRVDLMDFSAIAAAWMSGLGEDQWDPDCNISNINSLPEDQDYIIDLLDLIVLCDNWLTTSAP